MPKYIFTYHQSKGYTPGSDPDAMAEWGGFFEGIAAHVVDPGQPVMARTTIGEAGAATQLGGYTVVQAASLDEAVALARRAPTMARGGGVEVGELGEVPADHMASRLRTQLSGA